MLRGNEVIPSQSLPRRNGMSGIHAGWRCLALDANCPSYHCQDIRSLDTLETLDKIITFPHLCFIADIYHLNINSASVLHVWIQTPKLKLISPQNLVLLSPLLFIVAHFFSPFNHSSLFSWWIWSKSQLTLSIFALWFPSCPVSTGAVRYLFLKEDTCRYLSSWTDVHFHCIPWLDPVAASLLRL